MESRRDINSRARNDFQRDPSTASNFDQEVTDVNQNPHASDGNCRTFLQRDSIVAYTLLLLNTRTP